MTDHPSTFNAASVPAGDIEWEDGATVHKRDDGDGVLGAFKVLHRGTLAEMVRLVSNMPEDRRRDYVIQKAGDRKLEIGEILALASRDDLPSG